MPTASETASSTVPSAAPSAADAHAGLPASAAATTAPRLAGDMAMWLVILLEMWTFGLMFIVFAFARVRERALFDASQATLDLQSGVLNTVLLLTGSWCMARAVHALRAQAPSAVAMRWLVGTLLCAFGFMTQKTLEFNAKFDAGIDLSTNTFYTFYLMLAGFHYLHVAVATALIAFVALRCARGAYAGGKVQLPESAAALWHMVDLMWIVLFPLVYVIR